MFIKYKNVEYQCSMELTLDLIGGKWKSLILWCLNENTVRFTNLKRMMPRITQKMLTQQLRELEEDGLINRFVYSQIPPKVEYSLTNTGKSILPILETMCQWGLNFAGIVDPAITVSSSPSSGTTTKLKTNSTTTPEF